MSLCIILPSKLRRVIPRVDSCLHILLIEYINLASFGITGWYGLVIVQRIQCWTNHNNKWAVSNTSSPTFHPLKSQNESTEMKWKELAPVAQRETRSLTRLCNQSILQSTDFYFHGREETSIPTRGNWNPLSWQKSVQFYSFSARKLCTLTAVIEGKLRIRR